MSKLDKMDITLLFFSKEKEKMANFQKDLESKYRFYIIEKETFIKMQ